MTTPECDRFADLLVDYADGELGADAAAAVAAHVERCAACRERVAALRRSLDVARLIWDDAAAADSSGGGVERVKIRQRGWLGVAALAACLALLVAGGLWWNSRATTVEVAAAADVPAAPDVAVATDDGERAAAPALPPLSEREVRRRVARAGTASQLLAAADMLAEAPGGQEIACERYQYIASAYSETDAAVVSLERLADNCNGRITP